MDGFSRFKSIFGGDNLNSNNQLSGFSYYDLLAVHQSASVDEIRQNFHKLGLIYHPDKSSNGQKMMQLLTRAYNTLSNPQKRAHYDQTGEDGNVMNFPFGGSQHGHPPAEIVMEPLSKVLKDNGQEWIFARMQELCTHPSHPQVQQGIQQLMQFTEDFALEYTVKAFKKAMEKGFTCAVCRKQNDLDQICYCPEAANKCHCNDKRCCQVQKTGRNPDFA